MGKSKVLSNGMDDASAEKKHLEVRGSKIDDVEATKYLRRKLSLKNTHGAEAAHRIA